MVSFLHIPPVVIRRILAVPISFVAGNIPKRQKLVILVFELHFSWRGFGKKNKSGKCALPCGSDGKI
ncbi:hypothetical protein SLEP1_g30338 [Rubroshorea leprosula]|uniref:Uncharacterized protein n=1 Tax=Rubroshorea leprosula TaxID=152421 RepID=A0AAV5JZR3_9ROSI|nr:hypothetical protein SLEP1_g30338 [Rubroshorea leprosula]